MFKTDILFTGFYGQKNTGDDAFVEVASWGAKNIWQKNNNRFLAIDENLPNTIIPSRGYPFSIPRTYSLQSNLLIKNADYLISGGGSTIHSVMSKRNPKSKAVNRKQKTNDIKIGGIGVSVGPFKTIEDEMAIEEYLKSVDFLAVRDIKSFEYVSSLNLPYKPINAFDLAALLPEVYNYTPTSKEENKNKTLGVSVCRHESIQKDMDLRKEVKRNEQTIALLKSIDKKEEVHFKFYVINGHSKIGDYSLTLETIEKVAPKSYEVIEYSKNTQSVWKSIAKCDFVISTRLHAAIFACFSETPFMLNEYHRKCTDFLHNVDYNDNYRLFNSDFNPDEKANQIVEILNDKKQYTVPTRISEMKDLARLNFTMINL